MIEFKEFPKIPRLNREVIWSEKIDGTNACVVVSNDVTELGAQSRNKIITPGADNYGFARWVEEHRDELLRLGPGHHFGEWWGHGINRNYGLLTRHFSLFNVGRWINGNYPACVTTVPVLNTTIGFDPTGALEILRQRGSQAAPGFTQPEGIIGFHTASNSYMKVTLEGDEHRKWQANKG